MVDVLEGRFDPRQVAGRVVFVGATAAELQDLWSTPLGPARPGVWIQAMAYRTLAAEAGGERVLAYASPLERIALSVALSFVAAALFTASHGRRLAGLGALAGGVVAGSLALLAVRGLLVDPVVPAGVLALHYALGLEGVRRRVGASLRERDVSLATLLRVGESTAKSDGDGLSMALSLLGDVVDARGVALLRSRPDGALDGRRLEWRRRGDAAVGCAATAGEVLAARRTRLFEGRLPGGGGTGVAVYTPLFAGSAAVGVLVVEREAPEPLDATQLRTIATVGAQLALSAENLRLIDGLRRTFDSSIEAMASAVEARDGYTESHCRRLAIFASRMAQRLGLPEEEVESIRLGALLHDVGKIGIRDSVLLKGGRFDAQERMEMQRHAPLGHQIIRRIHGMTDTTAACVRHHHEWWDGSGYPDGLSGEEIPVAARIVAVVDVWDALSTARPYKEAFPQGRVREILAKGRGAQFDPTLVDLFLRVLDEEGEEMLALLGGSEPGRSAA
jgi:putative nucleotidyltransferase with HDIG domain